MRLWTALSACFGRSLGHRTTAAAAWAAMLALLLSCPCHQAWAVDQPTVEAGEATAQDDEPTASAGKATAESIVGGLSQFSSDENGAVPLPIRVEPASFDEELSNQPDDAEQFSGDPADAKGLWLTRPAPAQAWTIDYRFRSLTHSNTSYEFGTQPEIRPGWAPLSQLNFPLNSCWHGLRVGLERPTWTIHCEWLTPQRNVEGLMSDYDWAPPNSDGSFTDLSYSKTRWTDGQMLDFGAELKWTDRFFTLPIEVWPTGGFRWQRFDMMCYDTTVFKFDNQWRNPPVFVGGDALSYNQQYYIGYIGGQLRTSLHLNPLPPIALTFQGDWGYTGAYGLDHHLAQGDRYTSETASGGAWHVGLTAEAPLTKRLSVGVQADYMEISTHGTHHWYQASKGVDESWSYGESTWSNQTAITAFLRLRI